MTHTSTNYVMLKSVPKFNFCLARKFEYEPLAFCCGKGTIILISHWLPTELMSLYLGNIEESTQFRTYVRTYNIFAFTSLGVAYDKELSQKNKGIYTF